MKKESGGAGCRVLLEHKKKRMAGGRMAKIEFSKNRDICFIVPEECGTGVMKIARKVIRDVERTSGAVPALYGGLQQAMQSAVQPVQSAVQPENEEREKNGKKESFQAVIVVTAGCGETAEMLAENIPGLEALNGKRESYGFFVTERPLEGIGNGLVIYGSDRLGTIYGLFHLSEQLGVMPVLYWGDCPYIRREKIVLSGQSYISREPSVKYRGFFINDEWPCFGNWTTSHFGGFNAEMYDHIFEYLLRMKGNYMWPAMWSSSFLLDGPELESMKLADEYGIYIGMSHHEPCMRSGAEYSKVRGPESPYGDAWSYVENKEGILRFWEDGLKRSAGHHVFPTIGMRGENDSKMLGEDSSIAENVRLLKEIITKQREMIHTYLEKDGDSIPQLFAVYKEVEDYYFGGDSGEGLRGFEELEDVTLLLCEDNFGNMRALPEAFERDHQGGFGMYYHLDYHGDPVSYEWVASTPLSKIWEQMTEAYEYGVRELWIVNAGDVKFQEYPLNYFMNLAYDFETWGSGALNSTGAYTRKWIADVFGVYTSGDEQERIRKVLEGYMELNSLRRPEALNDTVYHPAHELESRKMLEKCEKLERENEELMKTFSKRGNGDAYYSMIYFPAAASCNLLKMHLFSGKNHLYARQGKAAANIYGDRTEECIRRDEALAEEMAAFKGGKWKGMELASHIGFTNWNDEDWRYPVRHTVRLPKKPRLVVSRADEEKHYTNQYFPVPLVIGDFAESECESVRIQIANGGQGAVEWSIKKGARQIGQDGMAKEDNEEAFGFGWLEFSAMSGKTELQDEVILTVRKERLQPGEEVTCSFEIMTETEFVPVHVRAAKLDFTQLPQGTFVPENKLFVINAADYTEKSDVTEIDSGNSETDYASFRVLKDFGKYGSGVKVFPVTAAFSDVERAPSVSYQLWSEDGGAYRMEVHTSPANPLVYGGRLSVKASVNDRECQSIELTGADYKGGEPGCTLWEKAVLAQEHVSTAEIKLNKGLNRITVYAQEAGLVLERLVLYPAQMKRKVSYLGPEESRKL